MMTRQLLSSATRIPGPHNIYLAVLGIKLEPKWLLFQSFKSIEQKAPCIEQIIWKKLNENAAISSLKKLNNSSHMKNNACQPCTHGLTIYQRNLKGKQVNNRFSNLTVRRCTSTRLREYKISTYVVHTVDQRDTFLHIL